MAGGVQKGDGTFVNFRFKISDLRFKIYFLKCNLMKKILIFSTAYFPFVGGAEVAVKEIIGRLSSKEFSAQGGPPPKADEPRAQAFGWDMITARMDKKLLKFERIGNINVYRAGCGWGAIDKFLLPLCGLIKALQLHKKNNYDIVWPIMASQASIAASFFKIFKPKVKLLLTLQEGDEEEHLKRYAFGSDLLYKIFIQPWHLLVFKKADYITAISNYLKERALKNGVKCEVEVAPNGVDISKFQITNKNSLSCHSRFRGNDKRELGIKENEKVIITTSRLVEKNGIDDLIDAVNI
ncbi:MAG: glycosyltransferase, partial [Patescibacteria group bacterium]|nr:glycosyltransferase [Patescibacteria group bacterium]